MKHYVGRVNEINDDDGFDTLVITYWPANWQDMNSKPDDAYVNLAINGHSITSVGTFYRNDAIDIWEWTETFSDGKVRTRVHVKLIP